MVIPVGDFISGAVYQKNEENDKGNNISDQDFNKAYVFSAYKQENWSAGLLFANYAHKNYLSSKNLNTTINGPPRLRFIPDLPQQVRLPELLFGNASSHRCSQL